MNRFNRLASTLLLTLMPMLGFAQTINDAEEHVLRGFFDRQAAAITYHQLAVSKASTPDMQNFARSSLTLYQGLADEVTALYRKFGLISQPPSTANKSPTLKHGVTRGVSALPEGYTWSAERVGEFVRTGKALEAMPAVSHATELEELKQLSGADFDKQYLLRVFLTHNAMMKHIVTQLKVADANADMKAFATKALDTVQTQSDLAQRLYENKGTLPQRPQPARQ